MKAKKILVLNGPNLDMLGKREPEIYGTNTLEHLEDDVTIYGGQRGVGVTCFQSNSEGKLIGKIHAADGKYDGIVYNPGAHTHYSYALRDAIASIDVPVVEVHLSDTESREPFRRVSVIAPACIAQVRGMGVNGYRCAIDILCESEEHARLGEGFKVPKGENIVIGSASGKAPLDFGEAPIIAEWEGAPDAAADAEVAEVAEVAEIDLSELARNRQEAVAKGCDQLGIAGILVRDTSNIQWLTAFDGVFDEERAHGLLVAGGRAVLHTDSRYGNALRNAAQDIDSTVSISEERMSHPEFFRAVLSQQGAPKGKLGIEDTITYAEYVKMAESFSADALVPTTDFVMNYRAVKDSGEITRIKAAQAVTDAAFLHIVDFMRPGMTERDVQLELEDFMMRHGAEGLAFGSIVATAANGADPHAIPGGTRLEAGQCVVMDFGARAYGYCSDMTRTVFLGEPAGAMLDAWETLRRANESVELMLRPGVTGAEAHQLAEGVLAEGGFGGKMGHGLGHGVGLDVHELPVLNPRNDNPLVEGNVVTVEPGIYIPGEFGMRLEDLGVITANGFDVFTQSTHEMVVI